MAEASVLVVDVEGYGDPHRDDAAQGRVRAALRKVLREGFAAASVPWDACVRQDQGDGVLFVIPGDVPVTRLAVSLVGWLGASLADHNRGAELTDRFRLRLALHRGEVGRDEDGLVGRTVVHTARLLDAAPLRTALRHARSDLVAIVSDEVHGQVGDLAVFHPVVVEVKKTRAPAWISVHGGEVPVTSSPQPSPQPTPSGGIHITGTARGHRSTGVRIDHFGPPTG